MSKGRVSEACPGAAVAYTNVMGYTNVKKIVNCIMFLDASYNQ